jgi:pyruvate dehydrogenase E1 component
MIDGFTNQLPDSDPEETGEWLDSFDSLVDRSGRRRARFMLAKLMERAGTLNVGNAPPTWTPYINTISPSDQPWFPGDEELERRIRSFIRWNAAAMVINANKTADGIGGHLSTFASSATLYEVGFNWFFRGKDDGQPGDHVYFQGHAAPGVYARAFLERRLEEEHLNRFRMEVKSGGLSSYPHPRLMPDFWEYPTVSMGLGPINSIYHARFNKYITDRRLDDTSSSRIFSFLGDGECDEPETLGAISLAGRAKLGNLVWIVNCNLQRLDGPVRGNGKIIQELEGVFRGAGWNVIKVVWGSVWDEIIQKDTDGVLLNKFNTTVDGEFQRLAIEPASYVRENFFGPDPRLSELVSHLTDKEIEDLPRGGHDYQKVFAAYKAATEENDAPTVILAKTVKGWTLGEGLEARNATHQIKKMTKEQLLALRERLQLTEDIPEALLEGDRAPYLRPSEDSDEYQYMMQRRRALGGSIPKRRIRERRPLTLPDPSVFDGLTKGSQGRPVSTTMALTNLLRDLMRDKEFGPRVVPIVPDEARTFGMDSLFREFGIYAPFGQLYEPIDHELLLSYREDTDGQLLEEGITEAGSLSSFIAAGTSYANLGVPMVPFFTFYSMFGFQRVGDLIWSAADARTRGFLLGATAGRTTLAGEGLQHQDGHSLVLATTVPPCQAYDPAFAYELGAIIDDGLQRMYGHADPLKNEDIFYYLTLYNEPYEMPARPDNISKTDIVNGIYRWADGPECSHQAGIMFSGSAHQAARDAAAELATRWDVSCDLWSVTSYKRLREQAQEVDRLNRLHPEDAPQEPLVTQVLNDGQGPLVAVSDFQQLVADQVSRWVPRPFTVLGTDGFGRSDTREALRRFFEVDMAHVVVAVLHALATAGEIPLETVNEAITLYGIDPESPDPGRHDTVPATGLGVGRSTS